MLRRSQGDNLQDQVEQAEAVKHQLRMSCLLQGITNATHKVAMTSPSTRGHYMQAVYALLRPERMLLADN